MPLEINLETQKRCNVAAHAPKTKYSRGKHIANIFRICYNASRQKSDNKSMWTKNEIPQPYSRTVEGFFFSFIVDKHPLGYSLSLRSLSNHLMM